MLRQLVGRVQANPNINVYLESELAETGGFVGNFSSTLNTPDGPRSLRHGVVIVATGAREYRGADYGFGSDPRIVTQQQFERRLAAAEALPDTVVMIQCVGPAEQYCSRICCTAALKNALKLKELRPEAQVMVLYKDIRVYGFKERLYTEARRRGVLFIRYDDAHPPRLAHGFGDTDGRLTVHAWDPALRREIVLTPDLVALSMPAIPPAGVGRLASMLRVPVDANGFFLEAHVKLRPVDFAAEGMFMAGMAHYPKLLDEAIVQAKAAASRAATILARKTLPVGGRVAVVDPTLCTACLTCVRICPYHVPQIRPDHAGAGGIIGAAYIEPAVCQGCGICASECPARAIQVQNYTDDQMIAKVDALFEAAPIQIGGPL
ncbi:MAG: 4Fe-4S binding protein [Anaerolineae bacterium]|nr:4Fe-4S binding protein [Anaerolineae bacterium]